MAGLEEILKYFGEKSKADIIQKFKALGLGNKIKNKDDFFKYWTSQIGPKYYYNSILPISRQIEILKQLMQLMPEYINKKADLFKELSKKVGNEISEKPAWLSLNCSDSKKGIRLQFGFFNRGCQYWKDSMNNVGCYNCGYFSGTRHHYYLSMTEIEYHQSIIRQLNWVETNYKKVDIFDGINIVGDGSFLNYWEIPKRTQVECFKNFAKWKNISRILIESRPEYINKQWLEELTGFLRDDQILEIAIGIESTDDFIRSHCINKGFGNITDRLNEYSIKNILANIATFKGRVRIQAYLLIKPAFLNEKEALMDAINSGRILYQWAKDIHPENPHKILSIKYEPMVVSRGTLLEVLYKRTDNGKRMYNPLNYWTVAELLAETSNNGTCDIIRFGAREDMDDYIALPVIPAVFDTISSIDFRVYQAVQNFTVNHSIVQFLIKIEPFIHDESYRVWGKKIGLKSPALNELFKTYQKEISAFKRRSPQKMTVHYNGLEKFIYLVQNKKESLSFFKDIAPRINQCREGCSRDVERFIRSIWLGSSKKYGIEIRDIRYVPDSPYKSVIFKIDIDNYFPTKLDLWISVPTEV